MSQGIAHLRRDRFFTPALCRHPSSMTTLAEAEPPPGTPPAQRTLNFAVLMQLLLQGGSGTAQLPPPGAAGAVGKDREQEGCPGLPVHPAETCRASQLSMPATAGKWVAGLGEQRVPSAEWSPAIKCPFLNFGSGQEAVNEADNCLAVIDRESRVSGEGGGGMSGEDYVSEGSIFLGFVYAGSRELFWITRA